MADPSKNIFGNFNQSGTSIGGLFGNNNPTSTNSNNPFTSKLIFHYNKNNILLLTITTLYL